MTSYHDEHENLSVEVKTVAWDVEEFKIWKGLDPLKPQWHGRGFACSDWVAASELMNYLSRNVPSSILRVAPILNTAQVSDTSFQQRVQAWVIQCFGPAVATDKVERNHRFLEEALELVQSLGATADEAHQLVDYVFGRPAGEPVQEAGGVMVTLATLLEVNRIHMVAAGETELARILQPEILEKIRAKQATKPQHGPLPGRSSDG